MYLYIFEDGDMCQSESPPTHDDLEMVDCGHLDIAQLKLDGGFHKILADGSLQPVPQAQIHDGDETGKGYHDV